MPLCFVEYELHLGNKSRFLVQPLGSCQATCTAADLYFEQLIMVKVKIYKHTISKLFCQHK